MDTETILKYMLSTKDSLQGQRHTQSEREGIRKNISCKSKKGKARVTILISDKINFKRKAITKDKAGLYIPLATTWIELEIIILSEEFRKRKTNTI